MNGGGTTFLALGASALLHGAVAATALMWTADPAPEPAGGAIAVEIVVLASPGETVAPSAPAPPALPTPESVAETAPTPPSSEPDLPVPLVPAAGEEPAAHETPAQPDPAPVAEIPPLPQPEPEPPVETAALPEPPSETAFEVPAQPAPVPDFDFAPPPPKPHPPVMAAARPALAASPTPPAGTASRPLAAASGPVPAPAAAPGPSEAEVQTAALPPPAEQGPADAGSAGGGGVDIGPRFTVGSAMNPLPRYPSIARRRGIEGRVILRVHVGPEGRARTVEIAESSTHSILDEAAAAALKRWTFEPARRGGVAIAATVDVPISFRLRD